MLNFSRDRHQTEVVGSLFTTQVQYLTSHFENLRKFFLWILGYRKENKAPSVLKLGFNQNPRELLRNFYVSIQNLMLEIGLESQQNEM